ncbi:hypothetical protein H206_00937 [Candidatus Electrothrix aarhusensis]|uniref:Uncharacterized protein n=1 Tax=Candidatus Electrothrix aarhusensis TaxID=1859131 RepID=A0A444IWZ8_9BACT|nr:hypothetical protein H206_00937 [Candidatus Electrothrix aarhusensis]
MLFQDVRRPDAELGTALGVDPIADRDSDYVMFLVANVDLGRFNRVFWDASREKCWGICCVLLWGDGVFRLR